MRAMRKRAKFGQKEGETNHSQSVITVVDVSPPIIIIDKTYDCFFGRRTASKR